MKYILSCIISSVILCSSFSLLAYNNPLVYAYIHGLPLFGMVTPMEETFYTDYFKTQTTPCIAPEAVDIRVLMYHYVRDSHRDPAGSVVANNSITPIAFANHMNFLDHQRENNQLEIMTFTELQDAATRECFPHHNVVLLTSDDGRRGTYSEIFPVIKYYNIPFVLGIVSEKIVYGSNREGPFMNQFELLEMLNSGLIEIQSHSKTHPDLSGASYEKQRDEICGSKWDLENTYGININTFIYPAGKYNATSIELLQGCGYSYSLTTQGGNVSSYNLINNSFTLKRKRVTKQSTPEELFTF